MPEYTHTIEPLQDAYKKGEWTYAKLSESTGMAGSTLCNLLRGLFVPRLDQAIVIAQALNVNPQKLFVKTKTEK